MKILGFLIIPLYNTMAICLIVSINSNPKLLGKEEFNLKT